VVTKGVPGASLALHVVAPRQGSATSGGDDTHPIAPTTNQTTTRGPIAGFLRGSGRVWFAAAAARPAPAALVCPGQPDGGCPAAAGALGVRAAALGVFVADQVGDVDREQALEQEQQLQTQTGMKPPLLIPQRDDVEVYR